MPQAREGLYSRGYNGGSSSLAFVDAAFHCGPRLNALRNEANAVATSPSPQRACCKPTTPACCAASPSFSRTPSRSGTFAAAQSAEAIASGSSFASACASAGFARDDTGSGHSTEQVAEVEGVTGEQLMGYLDAVHAQTVGYVQGLTGEDLGRVVDRRWDPPVTLGVRLVSVVNDDQQHVGQAAFVRGLVTA